MVRDEMRERDETSENENEKKHPENEFPIPSFLFLFLPPSNTAFVTAAVTGSSYGIMGKRHINNEYYWSIEGRIEKKSPSTTTTSTVIGRRE